MYSDMFAGFSFCLPRLCVCFCLFMFLFVTLSLIIGQSSLKARHASFTYGERNMYHFFSKQTISLTTFLESLRTLEKQIKGVKRVTQTLLMLLHELKCVASLHSKGKPLIQENAALILLRHEAALT